MRRIISPLITISLVMLACNVSTTVTPTTIVLPPGATLTQEINPLVVPTETLLLPTETLVEQTNTSCNQLAAYLDPALASSSTCETIPENPAMIETYPQHTKLTLDGYPLSGMFFTPYISILPVQHYTELLPDFIPGQVAALHALVGGGPAGDKVLPFLPIMNAMQIFHAQYKVLPFRNGTGIRFMTLLAQYDAPINNHDLFYTYQGLTSDGKYWVSAILPVNNPILPDSATNPPSGQTDLIAQLNSQESGNFTPNLKMLDDLVSSITIEP
jgi:hypothetical protein